MGRPCKPRPTAKLTGSLSDIPTQSERQSDMEILVALIVFVLVCIGFWQMFHSDQGWWNNPRYHYPKQQRQQFERRQRQQQQQHQQQQQEWERLHDLFRPRYSRETIVSVHPNATIVTTGALKLGQVWHVILVPWPNKRLITEADLLSFTHGQPWYLACTGEAVYPEGHLGLDPTFHNLQMAITCPCCREKMARIYHWNNQPYYSRDLYPIQCQLLISPDFIDWDIMKLHPSEPFKLKAST